MFGIKSIFILAFSVIVDEVELLETLPRVEDNNIIKAESIIRSTLNTLFSTLGLRKVKDKPKLKHFSVIHNYFVSLTLHDYNSLKEVAKLTRVNINNINETTKYEGVINEIIDEENVITREDLKEDDIKNELKKIELLKEYYEQTDLKKLDLNNEILNILAKEGKLGIEVTTGETFDGGKEQILNDIRNEAWYEDMFGFSGRRIYRGRHVKGRRYPFMVSVHLFNKFQCGGSIINSDLVITAASCVQLAWNNRYFRENPMYLSVRVGSSYYDGGGESINVMEVYFHPSYDPVKLQNNLAVLRLVRHMRLSGRKVKKIEIDNLENGLPTNVRVKIVGWGANKHGNIIHPPFQNRLRHAILPVYPLLDCQDIYNPELVTSLNFCAGLVAEGSGACNRDVGGPGVIDNKLVGVISFGAAVCGTIDAPTVFTKLGYYHEWIEQIMEQDVPRMRKRTTLKPYTVVYSPTTTTKTRHTNHILLPLSTQNPSKETMVSEPLKLIESKNNLRQYETKLFKEFLKTMFNGSEAKDYLEILDEKFIKKELDPEYVQKMLLKSYSITEKHEEPLYSTTPLQNEPELEFSTRMINAEPTEDEENEEKEETKKNKRTRKEMLKTTMLTFTMDSGSDHSNEKDMLNSLRLPAQNSTPLDETKVEEQLETKPGTPFSVEDKTLNAENNITYDEKSEDILVENQQTYDENNNNTIENSDNNTVQLDNNGENYEEEPDVVRIGAEQLDFENEDHNSETLLIDFVEIEQNNSKTSRDKWETKNPTQTKTQLYGRHKDEIRTTPTQANILKEELRWAAVTENTASLNTEIDEAILALFHLSDNESVSVVAVTSESKSTDSATEIDKSTDEKKLIPDIYIQLKEMTDKNNGEQELTDVHLKSLWSVLQQEMNKSIKDEVTEQQEQSLVTPMSESVSEILPSSDLIDDSENENIS